MIRKVQVMGYEEITEERGIASNRREFLTKDVKTYKMFRDYIDTIVDVFNIQKCVRYMEDTHWTWANCDGQVPTEQEFRENLREKLLHTCEETDSAITSSGGLTIFVEDYWKNTYLSKDIEDIEDVIHIQVCFSIEHYV